MTNEVSPREQQQQEPLEEYLLMEEKIKKYYEYLFGKFKDLPRLHFLTINPNSGHDTTIRLNKIGKWSDHIKKVSNNFFIVKEIEATSTHFHALLSLEEGKSFNFLKGIHMRLDVIGKEKKIPLEMTEQDHRESLIDLLETGDIDIRELEAIVEQRMIKQKKRICETALFCKERKKGHVNRVLIYMLKEKPDKCYDDYITMIDNKTVNLDNPKQK